MVRRASMQRCHGHARAVGAALAAMPHRRSPRSPSTNGRRLPNAPSSRTAIIFPNGNWRSMLRRTAAPVHPRLSAWSDDRLIGLMPVVSMWRAHKIPLPALVSAHPYGTLCTPLLDRDMASDAASAIDAAGAKGRRPCADPARHVARRRRHARPLTRCCGSDGLRPRVLQSNLRACLDATRDADELLHEALGAKKLKELRRLRHRLAEHGAVRFDVARTPRRSRRRDRDFLVLEASGWKGARGTALAQDDGDAAFIRRATAALADTGQCEIVDAARRRYAGRRRHRAAAAGSRVLLQDRRRRALCEILAGRAAHAGADAASLRRSRDRIGRFHRQPRSSHDQPDLARPLCDRRRADSAAASDPVVAMIHAALDAAQTRRANPRAAPFGSSGNAGENPREQRHRGRSAMTASTSASAYFNGECGAGSMMVECISSRNAGPLPTNSCQTGSFIAAARASARAFRLGIGPEVTDFVRLRRLGLPERRRSWNISRAPAAPR